MYQDHETSFVHHEALAQTEGAAEELVQRFVREGLYGLGQSYIQGQWDTTRLDSDIAFLLTSYAHTQSKWNLRIFWQLIQHLLRNPQTGRGVFTVGERHYDLGNDLFEAMLDGSMSYTCGMWTGAKCLEEAQRNKLRTICEKLELQPGMQILDVGCGWGNFAEIAAKEYGASVTGLTISKAQAEYATQRCRGLPVEIRIQDYREYNERVDRAVSIEMIEAVGQKNLGVYYSAINRALKPHGVFVLQAISTDSFSLKSSPVVDQYLLWLLRHIFPNGYLPRPEDLEGRYTLGFAVEGRESFGADYDRTLQAWRANFNRSWPELSKKYDERFKRMWEYYLCGCMAFFRTKMCEVYQLKYRKI